MVLDGRDRLHGVRLADAGSARLRQAEMPDFACRDQLLHGTGYVLHRHGRIDAVLIEKVDMVGAQALERSVNDRADMVGPAIQPGHLALLADGETELRADKHLVADRLKRLAYQILVCKGAVSLGCIEQRDAAIYRRADHLNGFLAVSCRPEAETQAHAAEADGRNFQSAFTKFTSLHLFLLGLFESDAQQDFDGAPLVHRPVPLSDVRQRQLKVEHLAGVDLAIEHQVHQVRQEAAHGSRTAHEALLREEQLLPIERDAVRHADIADHRAGPRTFERLRHRLFGAHAFQHGTRADAGRQLLDPGNAGIAALGHDVGCAVFEREVLPRLVAAHDDDPTGLHLLRREHAHEADCAVADNDDGRAWLYTRSVGGVPAGAEHVRCCEQARDQIVVRRVRRCHERAIGEGDARQRRLRACHEFALLARRLKAKAAMRTGVVGQAERSDDELSRMDGFYRAADLFDDAAILVAHRHRRFDVVQATEGPKVRAADAGRRQADDGVGRLEDFRLGNFLATHIAAAM